MPDLVGQRGYRRGSADGSGTWSETALTPASGASSLGAVISGAGLGTSSLPGGRRPRRGTRTPRSGRSADGRTWTRHPAHVRAAEHLGGSGSQVIRALKMFEGEKHQVLAFGEGGTGHDMQTGPGGRGEGPASIAGVHRAPPYPAGVDRTVAQPAHQDTPGRLLRRSCDQVVQLPGVVPEVVELIPVPDVVHELPAHRPDRAVGRRILGPIAVIVFDRGTASAHAAVAKQRQERHTLDVRRCRHAPATAANVGARSMFVARCHRGAAGRARGRPTARPWGPGWIPRRRSSCTGVGARPSRVRCRS